MFELQIKLTSLHLIGGKHGLSCNDHLLQNLDVLKTNNDNVQLGLLPLCEDYMTICSSGAYNATRGFARG